jgi:hypothetical protein
MTRCAPGTAVRPTARTMHSSHHRTLTTASTRRAPRPCTRCSSTCGRRIHEAPSGARRWGRWRARSVTRAPGMAAVASPAPSHGQRRGTWGVAIDSRERRGSGARTCVGRHAAHRCIRTARGIARSPRAWSAHRPTRSTPHHRSASEPVPRRKRLRHADRRPCVDRVQRLGVTVRNDRNHRRSPRRRVCCVEHGQDSRYVDGATVDEQRIGPKRAQQARQCRGATNDEQGG